MRRTESDYSPKVTAGIHGFYRVHIIEKKGKNKGKVVGDSGWNHNLITSSGLSNFITQKFLGAAGSSNVSCVQIASAQSSLPTAGTTSMSGEVGKTKMVTLSTQSTARAASTDGDTARYLGTFTSNFLAGSSTIGAVGLYMTTSGSIFCGGSIASSTFGTTQAINVTYDVIFLASTS
jgi:hypothetical protein